MNIIKWVFEVNSVLFFAKNSHLSVYLKIKNKQSFISSAYSHLESNSRVPL